MPIDDHAEDRDVGLLELLGRPRQAADAGEAVDGLGGDDGRPGEAEGEADAGEEVGQRPTGSDGVPEQPGTGEAPSDRAASIRSRADAAATPRHDRRARSAGTAARKSSQTFEVSLDAEPDDQQAEVGERRQAAQEVDLGLEHDCGTSSPVARSEPERHADDDGPEPTPQDAARGSPTGAPRGWRPAGPGSR